MRSADAVLPVGSYLPFLADHLLTMEHNDETYILLVLADSGLPTGSFVASSGLESYITHGFLSLSPATPTSNSRTEGTLAFIRDTLHTYAHSALAFVSDAHALVIPFSLSLPPREHDAYIDEALTSLISLDALYESMTLNHVARRASTAQGVALLALYTKAFATPQASASASVPRPDSLSIASLVDKLKLAIRRGETHGHLPLCWGVLTGALGLSLGALSPAVLLWSSFFIHIPSTRPAPRPLPPCPLPPLSGRTYEHNWPLSRTADLVA
jgi:urease accessory protein